LKKIPQQQPGALSNLIKNDGGRVALGPGLISNREHSTVGNTGMAHRERILDTQAGTDRMEAEGSGSHNRGTHSCGNSVVDH